ncbi:MAG: hypothetical protein GX478_00420 [Erysipelotrichaceae bacterium]|nr:hypothetical protein [Erysipelotrichaceae bacterium]
MKYDAETELVAVEHGNHGDVHYGHRIPRYPSLTADIVCRTNEGSPEKKRGDPGFISIERVPKIASLTVIYDYDPMTDKKIPLGYADHDDECWKHGDTKTVDVYDPVWNLERLGYFHNGSSMGCSYDADAFKALIRNEYTSSESIRMAKLDELYLTYSYRPKFACLNDDADCIKKMNFVNFDDEEADFPVYTVKLHRLK